jgi:ligand-binding sensor domain-containing protein/signal transduction histidine kinase
MTEKQAVDCRAKLTHMGSMRLPAMTAHRIFRIILLSALFVKNCYPADGSTTVPNRLRANLPVATASAARNSPPHESANYVPQPQVVSEVVHLPVVEGRDLRFRRISTAKDLSQTRVAQIVQDDQGFLWFGTQHGLDRYDGYKLRVFKPEVGNLASLSGTYVYSLFKDRSGGLWIGCFNSLDRFDPSTEKFTHYQVDPDDSKGPPVTHISQDNAGMLWLSTARGLYRLDPTSGRVIRFRHDPGNPFSLSSNHIESTGEDRSGRLWVATEEGLDEFNAADNRVALHIPLRETRELSFHEDQHGVFWITYASGNGLAIFDRAANSLTRYSFSENDLPEAPLTGVIGLLEDRDGNLWLGTLADGVLRYDRDHKSFVRYRNHVGDSDSLSENRVTSLFQDREGEIWVGLGATQPNFFFQRPPPFSTLPNNRGDPSNLGETLVNAIYEDAQGILWIGTTGALNRLDRSTGALTSYHIPGHGVSADVLSIVGDRAGQLWVGTSGQGLYCIDPTTGRIKKAYRHDSEDASSLINNFVLRLLIDQSGAIWATTRAGLDRLDPTSGRFTSYHHKQQKDSGYLAIAEDRHGAFWLSGYFGLLRFDPVTTQFEPFGGDSSMRDGLGVDVAYAIHIAQSGKIWVGTQHGLFGLDPSTNRMDVYREDDGLASSAISCILEDSRGKLWMSTTEGVSKFDPLKRTFQNYSVADGLPGADLTGWGGCFASATGEMFFGGYAGGTAFKPDQVTDSLYTPPIVLTDLELSGVPVRPGTKSVLARAVSYENHITLSHEVGNLSIEFSALSFGNPPTNRYRFMLDGLESRWNEVRNGQRIATYTSLPPGNYQLRVQGATSRGPWSEPGALLHIEILPPWWNAWWFRIVYGALFVLSMAGLYQLRVRQISSRLTLRMEERLGERTRIARDLHDTLLQGLVSASLQLEVADRQIASDATAKPLVQRISQLLRQLIDESRHRVRGLRLRRSEEENLERALTQISNDLAAPRKVKYQVVVEGTPRSLRPFVREEIYRIGAEALANAFRHADASAVETVLEYGRDHFRLLVRDDGKGIDPEVLRAGREGHFGLSGLRERAAKIAAQLKVRTAAGAGTEIDLLVPAVAAFEQPAPRGPIYWITKLYSRDSKS